MKLILTHEVSGLGAPGDIVEVKDGYGRNYLVPRGLGMRWTRGGEKQIDSIKAARNVREVRDRGLAEEYKRRLEAEPINLPVRAGAGGRLFGAVTVADIVAAVKAAGGPAVDKRRIEVGQPIKSLGAHQVSIRVHPEVSADVTFNVVPSA
jgi:large subunit ribosomal protein L9